MVANLYLTALESFMSKEASIKCPNCGTQIDVNEILYHQLENEFII